MGLKTLIQRIAQNLPVWRSMQALQGQLGEAQRRLDQIDERAEVFERYLRRAGASERDQRAMDAWYHALQELHRGSSEDLSLAQQDYIQYFEESADALKKAGPVLDLGCGRGEWVALLSEEGWDARGVDENAVVVDEARANGLRVECGDLFEALDGCPEDSLAGVTAFQVVEHLPFARVVALMHSAFRALRPGGILLFETPNPENLQVATYGFWMDPTHLHPIPPPLIMDLSFYIGFRGGRILRKNPWPQWREGEDLTPLESEVGFRLFGPQDYALLVYKPT